MTTVANHAKTDPAISADLWFQAYRRMVSIRLFEEQVNELSRPDAGSRPLIFR
jgi:TPP-dependent pyruvate/acetoin dehydrogenase alpha subunit